MGEGQKSIYYVTGEGRKNAMQLTVIDATKEGLDLEDGEETKKETEELNEKYADLREFLEVQLEGKVQKVTVSTLLTDSPAALVQGAYGVSPTMQRYMKAQSVASGGDGSMGSMNQAILEINPKHPIVQDLEKMVQADKESAKTQNFAMLMYDVASMTGGYEVSDTGSFAQRVMSLMSSMGSSQGGEVGVEDSKEKNSDEDKAIEPEVIL